MNGRCPADVLGLCGTGNDGVDSAGRAEWVDDGVEACLEFGGPDDGERDAAAARVWPRGGERLLEGRNPRRVAAFERAS